MNPLKLTSDIEARLGIKKVILLALAASLATNVLTAMALATKSDTHRQTIVPPEISKTFWVEDRNVSAEYLEQMGVFALQLALNNTPSSAEFNARQLLKYVAPASYGEIEKTLMANARELKDHSSSTVFAAMQTSVLPERNAISISGVYTTWIGDKRTSQVSKTYLLRFAYSGGRIYIRDMKEVDQKQPFKEIADETPAK
jgi:conjugal transfer pilus assembly protein TraE